MITQRNDNLTKEEELELGVKIQKMKKLKVRMEAGHDSLTKEEIKILNEGNEAFEMLVGNYYNLARDIAHKHHKRTGTRYSIEDLLQDAITALCESAYSYDPSKNCKLSTHAFYGITKRVSTTINYQRLVRMPENKMGEYLQIIRLQKEYNDKGAEDTGLTELEYIYENAVDLTPDEINLVLSNMQPQVSLNSNINDNGGELMDIIPDDSPKIRALQLQDLDESLVRVLNKLNDYERDLIAYEFGAFPASMVYSDFLKKYNTTDRKVMTDTRRTIKKMKKINEEVGE